MKGGQPLTVTVSMVGLGGALDFLAASTEPGTRPTAAVAAIELMNALRDSACRAWRLANFARVWMFLGMFQCSELIARMASPKNNLRKLKLD